MEHRKPLTRNSLNNIRQYLNEMEDLTQVINSLAQATRPVIVTNGRPCVLREQPRLEVIDILRQEKRRLKGRLKTLYGLDIE